MQKERLNKVIEIMKKDNLSQMIISNPSAIFYLTGKWIHPGERLLALYLNTEGKMTLFNNELFPLNEEVDFDVVWYNDTEDGVEKIIPYITSNEVGVDGEWPSKFLIRLLNQSNVSSVKNASMIIDKVRMQKDEVEKELMRQASKLNDLAMLKLQDEIKENVTEKELMDKLKDIYDNLDTDGFSFEPIIAFGENGANPHYSTGKAIIKEGDSVILDIGCKKDSYVSDMTRTVFFKKASEKSKEVYEIVKEAQLKAIEAVKPGVRFCDVDSAARDYITEKGYGKYFTHRTGHSIGIEVHDFGDVSAVNTDTLKPGMIFSIEPGIYLSKELGVRIEDLVMVTEDGCEILNSVTKDLIIVG